MIGLLVLNVGEIFFIIKDSFSTLTAEGMDRVSYA